MDEDDRLTLGTGVGEIGRAQSSGVGVREADAGLQIGHGVSVGCDTPRIASATTAAGWGSSTIV